jgi:hypothetical protein
VSDPADKENIMASVSCGMCPTSYSSVIPGAAEASLVKHQKQKHKNTTRGVRQEARPFGGGRQRPGRR